VPSRQCPLTLPSHGAFALCASQVEESLTDSFRVACVFSSQGMPLVLGRAALDAMETTYDLVFPSVEEKVAFVEQVRGMCVRQ
jgi:hypothetical protein